MIGINCNTEINLAEAAKIVQEIIADPMGGWAELPLKVNMEELGQIKQAASKIQDESEVLVCIGIGGSYLGHRAIIEALRPANGVEIVYAGNSLSRRELDYALAQVGDKDFSVNVISKSGTTLEPAVAFEAFKKKLIEKYGAAEAAKRIYATTDASKGTLHDEAVQNGYTRFVVPDNIGGRYSVLTAVGLLPLAAAGVDVDKLLEGAAEMASSIIKNPVMGDGGEAATPVNEAESFAKNPVIQYAYTRWAFGKRGYDTEVFASFEPAAGYFNEWLKQLFGESEGKNKQGVWPASVVYSTDLHSLGQFMQDGRRNLWETIIDYPTDELNEKVVMAVKKAHPMGGIPVITISVPSFDEKGFGELIYFFEMSCAISAKLYKVNPFDQPGVEKYKAELKKML
ncbi:glucose-6-phosphate isomerase [Candidatus Saccharibacteria bacterium]|nr:glucose-6-phosphate isomerase [Candidatus Saccharibacteria bacterium]